MVRLNTRIQHFFISNKLVIADNPIFDKHIILSFSVHLVFYLRCRHLAVLFIEPFKVNQFKRSLTRDFELVVM